MNTSDRNPYDPADRSLAADLLGYLRLPGGTLPSAFTNVLFDLWAKADETNKKIIEEGWPFSGLVLRAWEKEGAAALRSIAGIKNQHGLVHEVSANAWWQMDDRGRLS